VFFRSIEARLDQINLMPGCLCTSFRLLLEDMQHVDDIREFDGVDRAIGITAMVVHDFKHAAATEPLECLGGRMPASLLRAVSASPMTARTWFGKDRRSSRDDPIHSTGFNEGTSSI
jgi:hypothetical protein